ncbi:NAD-dependent epimerase/dehydratase family protein [Paraburkholderia sp. Tr-20389]|uniref:thioester reductase domain-containing protein n=1 Tax=Paraburkholderia sp. Tr-20389 TaxID=2703903 RepID=UPI00197F7F4D|nr:thioester reductase domain-containing protein [Paraburkholderia sp. Tr-20389]MBN3758340.1 NAD-dependent epimerase/dehydratase family protein [Paraburkholderia sp. Tr-20389]
MSVYESVAVTRVQRDDALLAEVEREVTAAMQEVGDLASAPDPDAELLDLGFDSVCCLQLAACLGDAYRIELSPTVFYDVHTARGIARWLLTTHRAAVVQRHGVQTADAMEDCASPLPPTSMAGTASADARTGNPSREACDAIAIVGMAGVLPGSADLDEFWAHLVNGDDLIGEVPSGRWDWRSFADAGEGCRWGGFMPEVECFDAPFFHISPREAQQMDPQQRLFLQVAWRALEDAAIVPSSLAGTDSAVFVGAGTMDYRERLTSLDAHAATGASHAVLANRLSFLLDLRGPSEPVDTACSSSLVALHRAAQAIRNNECSMAIVGGVNAMLTPSLHVALTRAGMLSPDGRCKTFDASANGYVRGEGAIAIVVMPLERARREGRRVHGVLLASAVNHGGRAASLTAPTVRAQRELIETAWRRAGVDPASAGYIEAHGTGTALGDPIEVDALKQAFATLDAEHGVPGGSAPRCGIGSVKTNIGHLEAAAGLAGLVKVLLAMRHRQLPAGLHCTKVNPYVSLEGSPFHIVDRLTAWEPLRGKDGETFPLRAGVSSFGFGGVNAHVVVQSDEQPVAVRERDPGAREPSVFVLSARDRERLHAYARAFVHALRDASCDDAAFFDDLLYTQQFGREAMRCRLALVCADVGELRLGLDAWLEGRSTPALYLGGDALPELPRARGAAHDDARRWTFGEPVNWPRRDGLRFVSLPTYPFARLRYWCDDALSPVAHAAATSNAVVAEAGDTAAIVEAIFRQVLGCTHIERRMPFVEMGADSILTAQIRVLIVRRFNVDLPLSRMLECGNVERLAQLVAETAGEGQPGASVGAADLDAPLDQPFPLRPDGALPLAQAQIQFVFLDQLSPANPSFNLPGAVRVCGPFSCERVYSAFARMHEEHEILRCGYEVSNGKASARLHANVALLHAYIDLTELLPREQDEALRTLVAAAARQPFDLREPPLARLTVVSLGDEDHVVMLCMHHIVADFSTVALLVNELALAGLGREVPSAKAASYLDYAWWESQHLPAIVARELIYWEKTLADVPGPLPLPFDRPRAARPSWRGSSVRFSLPRATAVQLERFAAQHESSVFAVLLAAFNVWLYRLSGRADIVVGCPYSNRAEPSLRTTVGPLAYALLLRNRVEPDATFEHLVGQVRRTLYDAFDHLYVPYMQLVEALNPPRIAGCNPLFQTMLNVIPLGAMADEIEPFEVDTGYTDYDLSMRLHVRHRDIQGVLQYSADLFDEATAQALCASFAGLLGQLLDQPARMPGELALDARLDYGSRAVARQRTLCVASTFTDRLLEPGLQYWSTRTDIALDMSWAGYNQLFQTLYDPSSVFFQADGGYRVILLRAEDWLRFDDGADAWQVASECFEELADALADALPRIAGPVMVLVLPDRLVTEDEERVTQMQARLATRLDGHANVEVSGWRDVARAWPVADVFDPLADDAGHVPFTAQYLSAVATFISRWIARHEHREQQHATLWARTAEAIHADIEASRSTSTPNGEARYAAPRNALEAGLADAFAGVLKCERVGIDDNFFDRGGHSLSAIQLLQRINTVCGKTATVADIFMAPTVRRLAERIEAETGDIVCVDLEREAMLPADIAPRLQPAAQSHPAPNGIVLTGATGFVGRFLLRELLDRTSATIYCIGRGTDTSQLGSRIREAMQGWHLWLEGDDARVVPILGDLGLPRAGLSDSDYALLGTHTSAIYHNATSMNHLEPFERARAANVDGVVELLRLAVDGCAKTFNYVSTLGVFSAHGRTGVTTFDERSPIAAEQHPAANGYTASKWVGEQLVHKANERGVPCNVFRLGLVTADSHQGRYDGLQSFHRLLKSCALMGAAFSGYRYDLVMTPVDYVARAMVWLGERHREGGGVFHLSSMDVTPMEAVFERYNRVAEPALEIVSYAQWLAKVRALYERGVVLPVMPLVYGVLDKDDDALRRLAEARAHTTLVYDCSRTQAELSTAGIDMIPFDDALMRVYLGGMLALDDELRSSGTVRMQPAENNEAVTA